MNNPLYGRRQRRRRVKPSISEIDARTPRKTWDDDEEAWVWRLPDGTLHREDGPAAIAEDGTRRWIIDGQLHRDHGPAVDDPSGYRSWWKHGKRHCEDGPAVIDEDGDFEWWLDGEQLTEDEWRERNSST